MTFGDDGRNWELWTLKSPPKVGTIIVKREGELSGTLVRMEDISRDPQFNVTGLWWTAEDIESTKEEITLEERVNALESALKAQDTVHKMTISAIRRAVFNLLEDLADIPGDK